MKPVGNASTLNVKAVTRDTATHDWTAVAIRACVMLFV
jgi:hypothetical protein